MKKENIEARLDGHEIRIAELEEFVGYIRKYLKIGDTKEGEKDGNKTE